MSLSASVQGWPSVAIQTLPRSSNARLSGAAIGLTLDLSKPANHVLGSVGSPQIRKNSQVKVTDARSPPSSVISSTWP